MMPLIESRPRFLKAGMRVKILDRLKALARSAGPPLALWGEAEKRIFFSPAGAFRSRRRRGRIAPHNSARSKKNAGAFCSRRGPGAGKTGFRGAGAGKQLSPLGIYIIRGAGAGKQLSPLGIYIRGAGVSAGKGGHNKEGAGG